MNVWYNTYRPQKFEEVIGQDLTVTVLTNAIKTNRIKNGYLLSGSRGVGKTTLARIFANQLNGVDQNPEAKIDIFEMDAASNTSVDDIRLLIENASTPPMVGKYKIFIIDEVHMLSKSAMNALLKILEEPPVYLLFIFATTNPEKILPTVLSRLIKLDLIDHTIEDLVKNMESIAKKEGMIIDQDALLLIAKKANGGQRDAINYLQTVYEYGLEKYTQKEISQILGVMPVEIINAFIYVVKGENVSIEFKKQLISNINKLQISPIESINQLLESILDSHFNGDETNSDLIPVLGNYINSNLPISSMVEVIAYIDYNYPKKIKLNQPTLNLIESLNAKPLEKKTDNIEQLKPIVQVDVQAAVQADIQEKPEEVQTSDLIPQEEEVLDVFDYNEEDFENYSELDTEIPNHDLVETNIQKPELEKPDLLETEKPDATNDTVVKEDDQRDQEKPTDLDKYNKIIANLSKDKKANTALITMVKYLSIAELDNKLTLINSNPQLNEVITEEMIVFLNDKFDNLLGGKHDLYFNIVKKKEPATQINAINCDTKSEHFYKVYGSRPENVPESVEVIKSIKDPIKKENTSIQDDEVQITDLFDI